MEFRRTGSSDDRRRRVLRDDITATGEEGEGKKETSSRRESHRRYNDGAATARQPRITDFIPQRAFSLVVPALLLLTAIAAIQAAYTTAEVRGWLKDARFAPFNPLERGSLAKWFASMLLVTGAVLSWIIYRVRMHRVDDFRGGYRIWLVAAAALFWAGMDVGTGLNAALSASIESLTGKPLLGAAHGWWLVIYTLVFGALAVRMLIEVRQCRPAVLCLVNAAFWLGCGTLILTRLVLVNDPLNHHVAQSTFFLLGHGSIALAVLCYSRHVFLDAQGLLTVTGAVKQKKKRAKPKEEAEAKDDKEEASEDKSKPAAKAAPAAKKDEEDDDEEEEGSTLNMSRSEHLSKAERKKLKKMQQTPQRRAA